MSVEAPKPEETTPGPAIKPVEATTAETSVPAAPETSAPEAAKETAEPTAAPEVPAKDEAVVQATPATEGSLGYKAPGLLKQFRYVKHYFWFSEEPVSKEALESYVKGEKADVAHTNAAWAQETGKGVLFFAKRAEDKANPTGVILLPEATAVTKVGTTDFSFKVGQHTHKFEAASGAERDSWVLAVQKIVEECKDLKADVTGRESYKKAVEGYAFSPVVAGAAAIPAKAEASKKSLDATTATAATEATPANAETSNAAAVDESKKTKETEQKAKKERSQSRKRNSVFGLFGKKDEEKAEKEHEKEVKKEEAEQKKEEAKAEHDTSKAKDAAEAAVIAAAPAAVVASVEKKEEDKKEEKAEDVTTPTEKKSKRASVFGGFFGKNKIHSPTSDKTAEEAGPAVPAKDDTPALSETAPKLDEPIDTKPIDAAAVTAPVDNAETTTTPAAVTTEEAKTAEPTAAAAAAETTTPKVEKKSFLAGLIKKHDKKEEPKEEVKANEESAKETATPAAVATTETAATEPAAETPAKDAEAPKEERPAREKRRTSLFGSLGTLKRKTEKSPEPASAADETKNGTKREKSPLPSKLGGLFRRPSRAAKTEKPAEEVKTDEAAADATKAPTATEEAKTTEAPATTTDTPANATVVEPKGESQIVGDAVPETLHTAVHDAVTSKPEEVKASA